MIAQAEHIPVHLGAMPDAVAAVMADDPGPTTCSSSTTRSPAARTSRTSRSSRAPTVGFAVTRAHHADVGGVEPGSMPADSRTLDGRGRRDPADPARRRGPRGPRRADAQPGGAPRRLPRAARRAPARRAAGRPSSASATGATGSSRRWTSCYAYSERVVRAALGRLPDGRLRGRRRARGRRRRPADPRRRRRSRATRSSSTSRGPAPQHDGQPQLPALGHALGLLLRRPLPDRSRPALLGRRLRARHRRARRRARSSTRGRPRPSPRGTSRPPAGSSTASSPPSARRSRCPRRARGR